MIKQFCSKTLKKSLPLVACLTGAALMVHGGSSQQPVTHTNTSKPNIVIIALDDIGFADLGCYGSEIHTPGIDSIARAGIRYNNFNTKAICSPTRASLLTGRNNQTIRMGDLPSNRAHPEPSDTGDRKGEMPANVEFLPEALRRSGYATFAVGKWHLSPVYERQAWQQRIVPTATRLR